LAGTEVGLSSLSLKEEKDAMKPRSRMIIVTAIMAIFLGLTLPLLAQNSSSDKPYQQWTISDVEKMLNNSPWAQTKSKVAYAGYDSPRASYGNIPWPESVTVRLHSALPIRQALMRLMQIKAKYDKMSDVDKIAFDAKQNTLLACQHCANNYVISLGSPFGKIKGQIPALKAIPIESLRRYLQLTNESGEKRELVGFAAPKSQGDDAFFYFSRLGERGGPLVTAANKKVILSLDPEIFWVMPGKTMRFEFDVSKMIKDGEVLF
jgi:hypothetical protein